MEWWWIDEKLLMLLTAVRRVEATDIGFNMPTVLDLFSHPWFSNITELSIRQYKPTESKELTDDLRQLADCMPAIRTLYISDDRHKRMNRLTKQRDYATAARNGPWTGVSYSREVNDKMSGVEFNVSITSIHALYCALIPIKQTRLT